MSAFGFSRNRAGRALGLLLACQARAGGESEGAREFNGQGRLRLRRAADAFARGSRTSPVTSNSVDCCWPSWRARADTKVMVQADPSRHAAGDTLRLRNFFARFRPQATELVLLMAHWDQAPPSRQEREPRPAAPPGARRERRCVGRRRPAGALRMR